MHAAVSRSTVPERAETTRPVVYTTLYDLIAAVNEAIAPGEEDLVAPIVAHLLRAGRARLLRDGDVHIAPCGRTLQPSPLAQGPARGAVEAYVPRLITSPSS